jgi:hypothetical protein
MPFGMYGRRLKLRGVLQNGAFMKIKENDWLPGENGAEYSLLSHIAASEKSVNLSN